MITECGFGNKLKTILIYFITLCEYSMLKNNRGRRHMVFGFTTIYVFGAHHH